jgi:hypothetical protein
MSRLIKKFMNAQVFKRHPDIHTSMEVNSDFDMDEWKGWDAWVDVKK